MPNYPDIRQGTRFSDTSARQWQSAFQSLEGVAGMTVGPGLAVIRSGDAIEIRLDSELERLLLPSIIVVVTEKPAEGDKALTVRRVIYGPSVPVAGEYQWADETTFVVFPEVGSMPADFTDLVWAPTENDEPILPLPPPTLEAQFLRARRRGEFWFVGSKPDTSELRRFVVADAGPGSFGDGFTSRDDALLCYPLADTGDVDRSTTVYVAKPYVLRVTPWHERPVGPGSNNRWVYFNSVSRQLRDQGGAILRREIMYETYFGLLQLPSFEYYIVNKPIVAMPAPTGLQIDGIPVLWQDLNVGGRHWIEPWM